jgi:hypothetical protein
MSATTERRLPVSLPNLVIVIVGAAGAVATAVTGNALGTVYLGFITVGILITALVVRHRDVRDISRINALDYADERDRRLAASGFAVVGAVAVALSSAEFVAATIAFQLLDASGLGLLLVLLAAGQSLVLCTVWSIANARAVRRG